MSSTSRFSLEPAPGGLELVQDLVNTRPVAPYDVRDLLGTVADAQRFTTGAVRTWKAHSHATGGVRRITSADLPALRRLRRDVERQVLGEGRVVNRGRRLVLAEATITDGAGRLLATATSSCLVFDLP